MGSSWLLLALLLALLPTTSLASTTPSTATSTADDEAGAKTTPGGRQLYGSYWQSLHAQPPPPSPNPPPPPPSPQPPGQTTGPTAGGGTRCDEVLDLVLVLDSSGSMAPYTYQMRGLALAIIAQFQVGRSAARIGYVDFSTGAAVRIDLTHREGRVTNAINLYSPSQNSRTAISSGLDLAAAQLASARSARPTARTVALLITDGVNSAEYGGDAAAIRSAQRLKSAGGLLISVGFGGADPATIAHMASTPSSQYSFYGQSFGQVEGQLGSTCRLITAPPGRATRRRSNVCRAFLFWG